MERNTKEVVTVGGHKVVLNTYLTGGEGQQLKAVLFNGMKMSMDDLTSGVAKVTDVPAGIVLDQQRKAFEFLVVSVDGVKENAVKLLEDLPSSDFEEIEKEIDTIRRPFKTEK